MGHDNPYSILIEDDQLHCDYSLRFLSEKLPGPMDLLVVPIQDLEKNLLAKRKINMLLVNGIDRMTLTDADLSYLHQLSAVMPVLCIAWDGLTTIKPIYLNSGMEFYLAQPSLIGQNYCALITGVIQSDYLASSSKQSTFQAANQEERLIFGVNKNHEICLINKQVYLQDGLKNAAPDSSWIGTRLTEKLAPEERGRMDKIWETPRNSLGKETFTIGTQEGKESIQLWPQEYLRVNQDEIFGILFHGMRVPSSQPLENTIQAFEHNSLGLFDSIQEGLIVTDHNRLVLHSNSAFLKCFGYKKNEILGKSTRLFYESESQYRKVGLKLTAPLAEGSVIEIVDFKRKDGTNFPGEIGIHPLVGMDDKNLGYVSIIRDVSQRLNAENEKKKIEDSLRQTLILARLSRWTYHFNSEEFKVSEEFHRNFVTHENWLKISKDDFLQKWVHPEDRMIVENAFNLDSIANNPTETEFRLIKSDQSISYIYAEISSVLYDTDGSVKTMEGFLQDITERKMMEDRYREREKQYQKKLSEMLGGFVTYDVIFNEHDLPVDFIFREVNREFEYLTGKRTENVLGKSIMEVFPNSDADLINNLKNVFLTGESINYIQFYPEAGIWYDLKLFKASDEKVALLFFNVTEREINSRAIKLRNKYLSAMQETTLELVSEHNISILLDNIVNRACELFDAPSGFLDFMQPDGFSALPPVVTGDLVHEMRFPIKRGEGLTGTVWKTGEPMLINDYDHWPQRIPGFRKNYISSVIGVPLISKGEILGVLVLSKEFEAKNPFTEVDMEILIQFARLATIAIENVQLMDLSQKEIIERIRTEEELIKSEEAYRSLFENVPDGVYRTSVDGKFIAANPAYLKIFGYDTFQELCLISVNDLYVDPKKRDEINTQFKNNQDSLLSELHLRRKDGKKIIVLDNCRAIRNPKGEIVFFEGTITEITERKKAEQVIVQQSEELSRLYRASASLITDISNNLEHLAQTIVNTTQKEFNQVNCSLFIAQPNARYLKRAAIVGPCDNADKYFVLDSTGKGVVSKAYRTGQVINITDISQIDDYLENWNAAKSELSIPLKVGDKIVGVLDMESSLINAFNADDIRLLIIFAEKAAFALEQALFTEKEQKRIDNLLHLQKLGNELSSVHDENLVLETLVNHAGKIADNAFVYVFYFNPNQTCLRLSAQSKDSMAAEVPVICDLDDPDLIQVIKEDGRAIIWNIDKEASYLRSLVPDESIQSLFVFSLINEGKSMGVIAIAGSQLSTINQEETTTFELLAKIASTSLVNARLFESTRRNLDRLASLRRIDLAIASSTDLTFTLDVLLEQVISQLNLAAATILKLDDNDFSLKLCSERGFKTTAVKSTHIPIGVGCAGKVAFERIPVIIEDLRQVPRSHNRENEFIAEGFISYICVPIIAKGKVKGVLEAFLRVAFSPGREWMDYFELISGQAAIAIESIELFSNLQRSNADLSRAYDNTLEGWASALELRDKETEGHTRRVASLAIDLANAMEVKSEELVYIRWGALLHDIGKMAIPDEILLKPGALNEDEWIIMKQHPQYAFDMLSKIDYLRPALDIPYAHHEKWNGSGYPRGLAAEQIPLAARLFAIVDVWDALVSDRPYRKAWSENKTIAYIIEEKGQHFDPRVVEAFLRIYKNKRAYPDPM